MISLQFDRLKTQMKLFTISTLFFLFAILYACSSQKPSKTIKDVFNQEHFDSNVVGRLAVYDSLKNILVTNVDTIFGYRKVKREFDNNATAIPPDDVYNFIFIPGKGESSDKISLETLPPFIYSKVDSICRKLGEGRIAGFDLQRNKIIVNITIKNNYDEETSCETQHTLTWNWDHRVDEGELDKDTVLGNGWIYYIQTKTRHGR